MMACKKILIIDLVDEWEILDSRGSISILLA